jgi:membrane-bound lytic murein transglycosylase D
MKCILILLTVTCCAYKPLQAQTMLPVNIIDTVAKNEPVELLKVTVPSVPDSFVLFGEKVPLHVWDVHERFDRELLVNTYLHGPTLYILKLYKRYMHVIEERLKANNVPDDFKYLCVAESALQNQISKAGATGFWQFMRGTAPGYGLEVNAEVDERYNPEKSTDAACKYLLNAYNKFGSWTAAAASYNCGMGGYNGAATAQGNYNYYNLLLPDETMRYIFRIMALKYILENPARSGFNLDDENKYDPHNVKKVLINYPVPSLVKFAMDNGTNYKTIKLLNPWLRGKSLSNRKYKPYTILLPAE